MDVRFMYRFGFELQFCYPRNLQICYALVIYSLFRPFRTENYSMV